MTKTSKTYSALEFALLIDRDPKLTENVVTDAYRAALRGQESQRDIEEWMEGFPPDIAQTREEIGEHTDDPLSQYLAAPVEGKPVITPTQKTDTAGLTLAVARFVAFTGRLPHLGTWDDRQAVWNLVGGSRAVPTPLPNCQGAYAARSAARSAA